MAKIILGVSGKIGSGKDTLARWVAMMTGAERIAFADALKLELHEIFEIPLEWMYSRDGKEKQFIIGRVSQSVREWMQWWGQRRRNENPRYWVEKTFERVKRSKKGVIVITDVRRTNEWLTVSLSGGQILRLDPYPGWKAGTGASDVSETALDDFEDFDLNVEPSSLLSLFILAVKISARIWFCRITNRKLKIGSITA